MNVWLVVLLGLLLAVIVALLSSSIHFHFRFCRVGNDDRAEFDIRAVFGLVKLHYELPALKFAGFSEGLRLKLEESGSGPFQQEAAKSGQIDREAIAAWIDQVKQALKATRGLQRWFRETLSRVRISQLDWSTDFSLGDAAFTATAAGALWGLKWGLAGWLSKLIILEQKPRLFVAPVFRDELSYATEAECAGRLHAVWALYAGVQLLKRVSKVAGGFKEWRELLRSGKGVIFGKDQSKRE